MHTIKEMESPKLIQPLIIGVGEHTFAMRISPQLKLMDVCNKIKEKMPQFEPKRVWTIIHGHHVNVDDKRTLKELEICDVTPINFHFRAHY